MTGGLIVAVIGILLIIMAFHNAWIPAWNVLFTGPSKSAGAGSGKT